MKKNFLLLILPVLLISGNVFAQENGGDNDLKTVFGNKKISHGGYAGLTFGMDELDGSYAFHSGFRAAWMIGHSFGLGFAASGFSNNLEEIPSENDEIYNLSGGYGGIMMEPVFAPRLPVHITFPIVAGGGAVVHSRAYKYDDHEWDMESEDESVFFMFQPGAEIEVNLLKHLRISAGASWKFTTPVHIDGKSSDMFGHPMYQVSLKFGKF